MGQDRFRRYYSSFESRKIGELEINIAPTRNDIPVLEYAGFDEPNKSFVIIFKLEHENAKLAFEDELLEIHAGMNTNKISKIVVKNVDRSNIGTIRISFETTLERFEKNMLDAITDIKPFEDRLRRIGNYDIMDRQLKETKDLLATSF